MFGKKRYANRKRVAYQARVGKKRGVVVDGVEQKQQYDRIGRLVFQLQQPAILPV